MAMEKMAVTGGSSISARQWVDFWEKVELRKIHGQNFQSFLDNPDKFAPTAEIGLISLSQAKKILGRKKIITVTNYNKVWGKRFPEFPIFYSEEELSEAAWENDNKGRDWYLVFYGGNSIINLRQQFGKNPDSQPCFYYQSNDWYLEEIEKFWAAKTPKIGYYLTDLKGHFDGFNHEHQEKHVKELGIDFEYTNPHVYTETAFTLFKLTGVRLTKSWYWTSTKTALGDFLILGHFDSNGFTVGRLGLDNNPNDSYVSVCRIPKRSLKVGDRLQVSVSRKSED